MLEDVRIFLHTPDQAYARPCVKVTAHKLTVNITERVLVDFWWSQDR